MLNNECTNYMQDKEKKFEDLMISYFTGNITDNQERLLIDYLKSNPDFKIKYSEMAKTRAISFIPSLENSKKSNYRYLVQKLGFSTHSKYFLPLFQRFLRVAAIVVFILSTSISAYYFYINSNTISSNLAITETIVPLGSQTKMILPDSSVVWLNSGTILKYDNEYGKKNRELTLVGEAYFEVRKDKSRPFVVTANNLKIKVLGTIFNVRSYIEDPTIEVNLLEGKVDVYLRNSTKTAKRTLLPNEKMVYNKKSSLMQTFKTNASKSAQWTIDKLCFVDAPIEKIMKDLERKFDVQIIIENNEIKNEVFSGSINMNQPLNQILDYIDVDKKFKKLYDGKTITIKRN